MPILSNPQCHESWSETIQHDILDKTHSFLSNLYVMIGNTKGETLLPLPPENAYAGDPASNKERIHMLESAIVRWSKQINVRCFSISSCLSKPDLNFASHPVDWEDCLSFILTECASH